MKFNPTDCAELAINYAGRTWFWIESTGLLRMMGQSIRDAVYCRTRRDVVAWILAKG